MKAFILFLISCFFMQGCILVKDAAYQRDIAYYTAQQKVAEAQIAAQEKPLATFTAQSGEVFTVNNPNQAQISPLRQHENRAWRFGETLVTSTPLSILAGGWAVSEIVQQSTGDIVSSGSGDIDNTSNSNNQTEFSKSEGDMTENSNNDSSDNSDNSQIDDNSDNSINENWTDDNSVDNTATPTVVTP